MAAAESGITVTDYGSPPFPCHRNPRNPVVLAERDLRALALDHVRCGQNLQLGMDFRSVASRPSGMTMAARNPRFAAAAASAYLSIASIVCSSDDAGTRKRPE
jgi:hypothetical protein